MTNGRENYIKALAEAGASLTLLTIGQLIAALHESGYIERVAMDPRIATLPGVILLFLSSLHDGFQTEQKNRL